MLKKPVEIRSSYSHRVGESGGICQGKRTEVRISNVWMSTVDGHPTWNAVGCFCAVSLSNIVSLDDVIDRITLVGAIPNKSLDISIGIGDSCIDGSLDKDGCMWTCRSLRRPSGRPEASTMAMNFVPLLRAVDTTLRSSFRNDGCIVDQTFRDVDFASDLEVLRQWLKYRPQSNSLDPCTEKALTRGIGRGRGGRSFQAAPACRAYHR